MSKDPHPFLLGDKIYLRPLELKELREGPYLCWLNDPEVTKFLETGFFPTTHADLEQFYRNVVKSPENIMLAIVDRKTDQHIGNVKLGSISWLHRFAEFGIMIGDKSFWGHSYGTEVTQLTLQYGFMKLNLNKITLVVHASHESAIRLYRKLGFKIEGTLRSQFFCDGAYTDKYLMGILRDEFVCDQ